MSSMDTCKHTCVAQWSWRDRQAPPPPHHHTHTHLEDVVLHRLVCAAQKSLRDLWRRLLGQLGHLLLRRPLQAGQGQDDKKDRPGE